MFIAKVIGQVVSTKKEAKLSGHRLLMLRPLLADPENPKQFKEGSNTIVAIDTIGSGLNEVVLFVQGSSARQLEGCKNIPVDASIVGIVDSVKILGKNTYQSGGN